MVSLKCAEPIVAQDVAPPIASADVKFWLLRLCKVRNNACVVNWSIRCFKQFVTRLSRGVAQGCCNAQSFCYFICLDSQNMSLGKG